MDIKTTIGDFITMGDEISLKINKLTRKIVDKTFALLSAQLMT